MTNQNKSNSIISTGLYLVGYGVLCWSEGWVIALAVFLIQWAGNLQWGRTHDKK